MTVVQDVPEPDRPAEATAMAAAAAELVRTPGADDRLLRRLDRVRAIVAVALGLLGSAALLLILEDGPHPLELLIAVLAVLVGAGLLLHHQVGLAIAARRSSRETSMTRILQGLSRSLSPEAVVDAIVQELSTASGADHVVVARVRQADQVVEVTLSAARSSVPASQTYLRPEVPALSTDVVGTVAASPGASTGRGVGGTGGSVTQAAPGHHARLASQAAADEIARRVRSAYGLPHTLAVPLLAERRFLGALILSKRTPDCWSDGDRRLLTWAAREVAAAFARAYALEEAERDASTDALTGLSNRRAFDELVAAVPHRRRASDDLAVLMVDIDRFKRLNDEHGHATGDAVLRAVAAAIAGTVRAEDTPARYGGEEFAVILRRASAPMAAEVGERVRRAVAAMPPERLGVTTPVTVSVGVAVAAAEEDIAGVIERADQALYLAKRRGRDRVEVG